MVKAGVNLPASQPKLPIFGALEPPLYVQKR